MQTLYSEIDPYCQQWLCNLQSTGHIQPGDVYGDLATLNEGEGAEALSHTTRAHFFAGIGVWDLVLELAGWPRDREVWTGSCPCQPFSLAGRGRGERDPRHLWPVWLELIKQHRPAAIFGEQVASPAGRDWLRSVQADLEALGYRTGAADLCAAGVGAPHVRSRLWFCGQLADPDRQRCEGERLHLRERGSQQSLSEARRRCEALNQPWRDPDWIECSDGKARPAQPGTFPLAYGAPENLGRLRAYGNAIVPQIAAAFVMAAMDL